MTRYDNLNVGDIVESGTNALTDYDTGRVVAVQSGHVVVAWESGMVRTTVPFSHVRKVNRVGYVRHLTERDWNK